MLLSSGLKELGRCEVSLASLVTADKAGQTIKLWQGKSTLIATSFITL